MNGETKSHDLPTSSIAAQFWYNKTSCWTSSNSKCEYIPVKMHLIQRHQWMLYVKMNRITNKAGHCRMEPSFHPAYQVKISSPQSNDTISKWINITDRSWTLLEWSSHFILHNQVKISSPQSWKRTCPN